MTTTRKKDPSGLMGNMVTVLLDGAAGDPAQTEKLMRGLGPAARIEALRRHPGLAPIADELASRLRGPRKTADMRLMHDIAQAEFRALHIDAAPKVIIGNAATKQRKGAGFSSARERAAERKPVWDSWQQRANELHAANRHRSKSDICNAIGREFGVTGRAVAKRVALK
ncbi:MAG: hypothetical protein QM601_02380 [Pseudoxanthomonas sp.]